MVAATLRKLAGQALSDARDYASTRSRVSLEAFMEAVGLALVNVAAADAGEPGVAYVSASGSDTTGQVGTNKAFATPAAALAALALVGGSCTMYVAPGAYIISAAGLTGFGLIEKLAIVGPSGAIKTIFIGGDATHPLISIGPTLAPQLDYLLVQGIYLLPAIGPSSLEARGGASATLLGLGVEFVDVKSADVTLERIGPFNAENMSGEAPPDASGIGTLTLRELGNRTTIVNSDIPNVQIRHDYAQAQPTEQQTGYFLRSVRTKQVNIYNSARVGMDANCTISGNAGAFLTCALATSTTHNPYVQCAAQIGAPDGSPQATAGASVACVFSTVWAATGSDTWGLDLTGAQIYGSVSITTTVVLAADLTQAPAKQFIGGTGTKIAGNLSLIGGASGGGNKVVYVAFRGLNTAQQISGGTTLLVNGFFDLDLRGSSTSFGTLTFSNGGALDADERVITVASAVPAAVTITPPLPSYVTTDYSIACELAAIAPGDLAFGTKTAAGFVVTPENAAASAQRYTITRRAA